MIDLKVSNKQRVFNLFGATVTLPEPVVNKLNYGDRAYKASSDEAWRWDGTAWVAEV